MSSKDRVVLAYSGGLDTSVAIGWIGEQTGREVVAVAVDVGQGGEDLEVIRQRALDCGAVEAYVADARDEFAEEYCMPALKANALYEGKYPLVSALSRPVITKHLVKAAREFGATTVAHGCTGKGNDQVRFELAIKAFAPDITIIAPWREWSIKSREEEIEYAEAHNVPLKISRETNYSKDKNIWHLSHEGLDLEDPKNEPQYNKPGFLEMGVSPEMAPDKPTYVTLHFEKGIATAIDGKEMGAVELVETLNKLGGENGIGLLDIVENRLVGMKCRGVYETPGGAILYKAHKVLETICLDKETVHYKALVAQKLADLVYSAQWFTPLTKAILSFVKTTQETVTGDVTLKLYKGNMINAGVSSPYSLYDPEIATFDEDDVYNQSDATGFINLYGLPTSVYAKMKAKNNLN